jgi:hypothetical protein
MYSAGIKLEMLQQYACAGKQCALQSSSIRTTSMQCIVSAVGNARLVARKRSLKSNNRLDRHFFVGHVP